jgi:hypothetical protein
MTISYPSLDSLIIICLSIYVGHLLFAFRTWCHFLAMCLRTVVFFSLQSRDVLTKTLWRLLLFMLLRKPVTSLFFIFVGMHLRWSLKLLRV